MIATIIATVAMFYGGIKSEMQAFRTQLDRHERIIITLVGDVQRVIGIVEGRHDVTIGSPRGHES